ncbi:MAG: exodeoxyribonuclease I, partial [Coxiellaceae bacterium]|nr:exodeoxyribonuclease I [Coxiellaceae bacterium]
MISPLLLMVGQYTKTDRKSSMEATYLFYDIETTGLNPCFDQILQFAAIRTDLSLNEIERHEVMIRLNRDVTPHPEAMKTHGISLEEISQGENEYEAIKKIHRLFNTPGTISLGYNTLGFDDEFLRFSFYRNLLPPYTHQFANGCGRMDIYPMALLYYLFKPSNIVWPKIDGRVSLKLENINEANQFIKGQSHLAMVDVEVTLALAKQLYEEREMWDYLCGYFVKAKDQKRLSSLTDGIVVSGKIGNANNFCAPAIPLGTHRVYNNQSLWLRMDDEAIQTLNTDNIPAVSFAIRKKPGETPIILPPQDRFLKKISSDRLALAEENKTFLTKNTALLNEIQEHHRNYTYPEVENIDADAALYTMPFPTREEEQLYYQFHQASPLEKQNLMELFQNPIRKQQALRILGRHYPDVLSHENHCL